MLLISVLKKKMLILSSFLKSCDVWLRMTNSHTLEKFLNWFLSAKGRRQEMCALRNIKARSQTYFCRGKKIRVWMWVSGCSCLRVCGFEGASGCVCVFVCACARVALPILKSMCTILCCHMWPHYFMDGTIFEKSF